jgi:hypothetical protein
MVRRASIFSGFCLNAEVFVDGFIPLTRLQNALAVMIPLRTHLFVMVPLVVDSQ